MHDHHPDNQFCLGVLVHEFVKHFLADLVENNRVR